MEIKDLDSKNMVYVGHPEIFELVTEMFASNIYMAYGICYRFALWDARRAGLPISKPKKELWDEDDPIIEVVLDDSIK